MLPQPRQRPRQRYFLLFLFVTVFCGLSSLFHLPSFSSSVSFPLPPKPFNHSSITQRKEQTNVPTSFFRISWERHRTLNGLFHVVSASQDHRSFPPAHQLPSSAIPLTFADIKGNKSIFQFHATIDASLALKPVLSFFSTVELWTYSSSSSAFFGANKQAAERCHAQQPKNFRYRRRQKVKHLDLIIRCAFTDLSSPSAYICDRQDEASKCRYAAFAIHVVGEVVLVPVREVLHFLRPMKVLPDLDKPTKSSHPFFANAPFWRDENKEMIIERATQEEEREVGEVCAFVVKKYSWLKDDHVWLQWMFDVVGVDWVMVNLFVGNNPKKHDYIEDDDPVNKEGPLSAADVRRDLTQIYSSSASSQNMADRVILVETDLPPSWHTYEHMLHAMNWDAFLRWQSHCQYAFSLDMDEYIQLFSRDSSSVNPHHRVDVKRWIAQLKNEMEQSRRGGLYLPRLMLMRQTKAWEEEPALGPFLNKMMRMNGIETARHMHNVPLEDFGKSLFLVNGTLQPYLHFNEEATEEIPPLLSTSLAHMLHVRIKLQMTIHFSPIKFQRVFHHGQLIPKAAQNCCIL
ncbi:hypothetical protein QOT17_014284 [Balamuthia mandrillaris]